MHVKNPVMQLDDLIEAWERQQDAYVNHRAGRFEVILDALTYTRPDLKTVLDLGGGLGSFSELVLRRFPGARVFTVDYDPALLRLARHNLREYGDRSVVIEADLSDPGWPATLAGAVPDAVVSSTALHWLPTDKLVALYGALGKILGPGGVFFNADHLSSEVSGSFFRDASAADDKRQQQIGFSAGVPDWDGWWSALRARDEFAELVALRDRRFAAAPENLDATPALHTEALRVAGFGETGTLWQYFDDYVVFGVR